MGGGGGGGWLFFFFFKQKTAYEIGTGDWSSDVCSSDLVHYQQSTKCKMHSGGNRGVSPGIHSG